MLIFIYGIILARHENLARRKWFIDVLFRYVVYCIISSSSGTSVKPEILGKTELQWSCHTQIKI